MDTPDYIPYYAHATLRYWVCFGLKYLTFILFPCSFLSLLPGLPGYLLFSRFTTVPEGTLSRDGIYDGSPAAGPPAANAISISVNFIAMRPASDKRQGKR